MQCFRLSRPAPSFRIFGAFNKTTYTINAQRRGYTSQTRVNLQYPPLEDIEPIERYHPGGFHPVSIGDQLHDGRYHITYKLGFGGYSTTWLARDQQCSIYVGIKIAAADNLRDSRESVILSMLATGGDNTIYPGNTLIPQLLDEFTLSGPNGRHRCIVTAMPGRMSLLEAKDASYFRLFQPQTARAIIAQIIQAVDLLHSQGIVHADIHLGNILLHLPNALDNALPDELYKQYGEPDLEPIERLDGQPLPPGVPTHGIIPVWLGTESEDISLAEANICLTDFGESFLPSHTQRLYSKTPPLLKPPEARFSSSSPISFPADVWAVACATWEILGQRPLFDCFFPSEDRVTADQVDVLGKLPLEWWEQWEQRGEWISEGSRGELELKSGSPRRPLEERFEYCVQKPRREKNIEEVGMEEKRALFSMLRSMLAFRPGERITIRNVMGSEWMREWGLPALNKMKESQTDRG